MDKALGLVKKELQKSLLDYLLLFTSGVFFLLFLKTFQGERFLSFVTILTFTFFYIIWGIYHHIDNKALTLKIMLEYILIGFTILLFLAILFP